MGLESRKLLPLPAPTETESTVPTDVLTDVSKPADERSSYSLPEDGTPVTIKTRTNQAHESQTSLLIEYFEGGKPGPSTSSTDRKPDVRVRLIPSKRNKHDHIQITESKGGRKISLSKKKVLSPRSDLDPFDGEDAKSVNSYASATEESNVSRNPIEIEIDRSASHIRRPSSPLVPSIGTKIGQQPTGSSELSSVPPNSFFDNSVHDSRSAAIGHHGPLIPAAAGAVVGMAAAVVADKARAKSKSENRDRIRISEKSKEKSDRKQSTSKTRSRTSTSEKTDASRRRSSRDQQESILSAGDASVASTHGQSSRRDVDQRSIASGASRSSINNPKLLETVEDAIRRLILPELMALKREQISREKWRGSQTSTGTSVSREDILSPTRRISADRRATSVAGSSRISGRDREARHDYGDASPYSFDDDESVVESTLDAELDVTPTASHNKLIPTATAAAAGSIIASLGGTVSADEAVRQEWRQKNRRRADSHIRVHAPDDREGDQTEYDGSYVPPLPLMSDINPSEMTRTSILSANTDRPHSATEEHIAALDPLMKVKSDLSSSSVTSPAALNFTLGTRHANISHGDLTTLARRRTGEHQGAIAVESMETIENSASSRPSTHASHVEDYYEQDRDVDHVDGYYPPSYLYPSYQPQHILSPIPSVAEDQSDVHETESHRLSPLSHKEADKYSVHSENSIPSNIMSREFDQLSRDDRSSTMSSVGVKRATYAEGDSDVGQKAVNRVGANPRVVHVPIGVESACASLVDGSVIEQSVLNSGVAYDNPRETVLYEDEDEDQYEAWDLSERSRSTTSRHDVVTSRQADYDHSPVIARYGDSSTTVRPEESSVTARPEESSLTAFVPEVSVDNPFSEEYEPDEYGHKVRVERRHKSTERDETHQGWDRYQQTPAEAAIAAGAVAALRAARSKKTQVDDVPEDGFVGEGVGRNKSFRQRAIEGRGPVNTPPIDMQHSGDDEQPRMLASSIPDWNDPMPEAEYIERSDDVAAGRITPTQRDLNRDLSRPHTGKGPEMAAAGIAAARVVSAERGHTTHDTDDNFHRSSDAEKRDTIITNPYADSSPIINPALNDGLLAHRGYGGDMATGFSTGPHQKTLDEGYMSQGPNRTPDMLTRGGTMPMLPLTPEQDLFGPARDVRDLFSRMSGMSHGMASPFYDGATGNGVEHIQSNDIISLMQFLISRDAKKDVPQGALVQALVQTAVDMQKSFSDMERLIIQTKEDINDNTDKTVFKAINGPRPYPGSIHRSFQAGSANGTPDEIIVKKQNIFKRALKGLSTKGTNDLTRIEDMLHQLLEEVDTLKSQTARNGSTVVPNTTGPSYEDLQPSVPFEDRGYEPEGNSETSTTSHASQSGHLSIPQARRPSTRNGFDRKATTDHHISTVMEDNEDEYGDGVASENGSFDATVRAPGAVGSSRRGTLMSVERLGEPSGLLPTTSISHDNNSKKEQGKRVKSGISSLWAPKISRWSETTASSVGRVFRNSGMSRKDARDEDLVSSSNKSANYGPQDEIPGNGYSEDKLHSGFSESDEQSTRQQTQRSNQQQSVRTERQTVERVPGEGKDFVAPDNPKYKAHRDSINLQHPQPRAGQTELFRDTLESQAQNFSPSSPEFADWTGSTNSLGRLPQHNRYREASVPAGGSYQENWAAPSPTVSGSLPPRPPKEPLESSTSRGSTRTPPRNGRISKLQKGSPLSHHSNESGYGSAGNTHANYTTSPRMENRNLNAALGVPTRRPSGPRAMTPKTPRTMEDYEEVDERKKKRDTFGSIASRDSDRF